MTRNRILWLSSLVALAACGSSATPAQPSPARPAPAVDAVGEAAASYRVAASISPASVVRGRNATLALEIEPTRPDVHVQQEFPLRVGIVPSAGLSVVKRELGHADAVDPAARGRRWEVKVGAEAVGRQEVEATLRFAICKETEPLWCVTRSETVRAAVEVR